MDNSPPPNAEEYVTPPPRSTYPMLTSPAAPIAPRVFNMAQDENGETESETRVETSQILRNFGKKQQKIQQFLTKILRLENGAKECIV